MTYNTKINEGGFGMLNKRKKMLCKMLVFFMLFLGISFGKIPANSLLANTQTSSEDYYLKTCDAFIISEDACTNQMIGIRSASFVREDILRGCFSSKRNLERLTFCLHSNIPSHVFSKFIATANLVQSSKSDKKTVVLSYIHNQDGKK